MNIMLFNVLCLVTFSRTDSNSKKHLRIVGGKEGNDTEYPYIVRIEIHVRTQNMYRDESIMAHLCTGTVLSEQWTLTAAHCFHLLGVIVKAKRKENPKSGELTMSGLIRYGSVFSLPSKSNTFSSIIDVTAHPNFHSVNLAIKGLAKLYNDVGLIKTKPIKLAKYGKLSTVEYKSLTGQPAVAAGYGITQTNFHTQTLVGDTLSLKMPLQVMDVLITKCFPQREVYPAMCLASMCSLTASLCSGDSGGPLLHDSGVIAVNSLAIPKDCMVLHGDRTKFTGLVTPISPYLNWIQMHINQNS